MDAAITAKAVIPIRRFLLFNIDFIILPSFAPKYFPDIINSITFFLKRYYGLISKCGKIVTVHIRIQILKPEIQYDITKSIKLHSPRSR